ncbi:MAG: aldo/keto reductase [Candidatus Aminicenantaceae bacterium]
MNVKKSMHRREFLKVSTLGAVGAGIPAHKVISSSTVGRTQTTTDELKIKEYRKLGRTGFKVSDISAGEHQGNEAILSTLLDAGVNYIDTGESYGRGRDERVIGQVVKKRDRKSVFVTTKLYLNKDRTKNSIIERTRKCLERLQTDYIDCMMIHSAQSVATIKGKGFHDAMSELKIEGRVRFVGISNHGTHWGILPPEESMEKILLAAAEDGRFDVMLLVYNYLAKENGEKVLKVCAEKNIGTTLMKTNPVADYLFFKSEVEQLEKEGKDIPGYLKRVLLRYEKLVEEAQGFIKKHNLKDTHEIKDAAIRYALNNPHVHTVCATCNNFEEAEAFLKLSGGRFTPQDKKTLTAYAQGCGIFYCRHACGLCEPSCPHHVPVNSIMRYNHYFVAQHREKHAMQKYSGLPTAKADLCLNCEGQCEAACPFNVPIHALLINAHKRLTFA